MKIGIAVGRNTHTLVTLSNDGSIEQAFIANDQTGLAEILKLCSDSAVNEVSFAGNRRWAMPLAYGLEKNRVKSSIFSFKTGRGERGKIGNYASLIASALKSGIKPRPFFRETSTNGANANDKEEEPTILRLVREYLEYCNNVRILKHKILDCLLILFPEAVKAGTTTKRTAGGGEIKLPVPFPQPPDIFLKKMRRVLENPSPVELENSKDIPETVKTLAKNSLGRFIPNDLRIKTHQNLLEFITQYDENLKLKEKALNSLREFSANNPLIKQFGDGDTVIILIAMLAWRVWDNWRELRHYAGLDVSSLDPKGKARISRVRPEIRQYLYLLATRTKIGKELTKDKKTRIKKIECILKYLRHCGLKNPPYLQLPVH